MIIAAEVKRDEQGYWTHPVLARSGCETSAELSYWLRTHKLQCFVMTMRDEAPEAFAAGFTDEAPDACGWIPEPPNDDDGWFLALSTIPATDPSATGFGIPQNPDASAWRRCPTRERGKASFPVPGVSKHPLRKYCEKINRTLRRCCLSGLISLTLFAPVPAVYAASIETGYSPEGTALQRGLRSNHAKNHVKKATF